MCKIAVKVISLFVLMLLFGGCGDNSEVDKRLGIFKTLSDKEVIEFQVLNLTEWGGQLEPLGFGARKFYCEKDGVKLKEQRYYKIICSDFSKVQVRYVDEEHKKEYVCGEKREKTEEGKRVIYRNCTEGGRVGGARALKALWDERSRSYSGETLRIGSGDNFGVSSAVSGVFDDVPTVEILNMMGLEVDTFGNHNFDRRTQYLQNLIDLAKFKYVGSNLRNIPQNLRGVAPFMIRYVEGVPIAILGVVDFYSLSKVFPGNFGTLEVDNYCAVRRSLREAYLLGARGFIIISHVPVFKSSVEWGIDKFFRVLLDMGKGEVIKDGLCNDSDGMEKYPYYGSDRFSLEKWADIDKAIFDSLLGIYGESRSSARVVMIDEAGLMESQGDFKFNSENYGILGEFDVSEQAFKAEYEKLISVDNSSLGRLLFIQNVEKGKSISSSLVRLERMNEGKGLKPYFRARYKEVGFHLPYVPKGSHEKDNPESYVNEVNCKSILSGVHTTIDGVIRYWQCKLGDRYQYTHLGQFCKDEKDSFSMLEYIGDEEIRTRSTYLGGFVSDIVRLVTQSEIALLNSGAIRGTIHQNGRLTHEQLSTMFPYSNLVMEIHLSADELAKVLEHSIYKMLNSTSGSRSGAFLQISGIRFSYSVKEAAKGNPASAKVERIYLFDEKNDKCEEKLIYSLGQDYNKERLYKVVTVDYISSGGDGYSMLREKTALPKGDMLEMVREYFSGNNYPQGPERCIDIDKIYGACKEERIMKLENKSN